MHGNDVGWRPLGVPKRPADPGPTPAFTRLARVHAISTAADALFATALAGSLFFSIPVGQARTKVFAYLAGAIAPFSLLSPLIGPAIDRIAGGRRWMIIGSLALRSLFTFLLITNFDDLAVRYPQYGLIAAEYSYHKRALNDAVYHAPDGRGLGTFIWEPTRHHEAIFDQDGRNAGAGTQRKAGKRPATQPVTSGHRARTGRFDTNDLIDLYPRMAKDYGDE